MTGFDVLVLIIVGVSALLAFARGFVREFLSMTALGIAILAVLWGMPVFREPVREVIEPGWIADTATVIGLFLLVYIAVRVLTGRIHEWVHDSEPLGLIDRTAGILFGVARGFAIMAIGTMIITSVAKEDKLPKFLTTAKFYPFLVITADALKHLAPDASKAATDLAAGAAQSGNDVAKWRKEQEDTPLQEQLPNTDVAPASDEDTPKAKPKDNSKAQSNALRIETRK
jgi:membrane protein required for colicin V production